MNSSSLMYVAVLLTGVLISSISQVILKKAAMTDYDSLLREYLNPKVIFAYGLFFGATLLSVFAYRQVPLSMGQVLESTSYFYVTIFGIKFFGEKINKRKYIALMCIISGIIIYAIPFNF